MTLRGRLTAWSVALSAGGLALLLGFAWFEFAHEHPEFFRGPTPPDRSELNHSILEVTLFAGVPALALVFGSLAWLSYMRRALEPLERLTRAAENVHLGNLRDPMPRSGNRDEIDRLAEILTAAHYRVADAFGRVREFTLHASHELKTPLSILASEIETALREEEQPEPQRERLARQMEEIQRLAAIVDGLTLLTRADTGQLPITRSPVRLDQIVGEVFEDAQALAQDKRIRVQLEATEPVTVSGDRNRLRQLLLNLVDNAIKHNHLEGTAALALRCAGTQAEIQVTNSGPGLSREMQYRVFDRFFRGEPAVERQVEGSGLGLSIARWVVEAHDGRITFYSEPGRQTTVRVLLPRLENGAPAGSATDHNHEG